MYEAFIIFHLEKDKTATYSNEDSVTFVVIETKMVDCISTKLVKK